MPISRTGARTAAAGAIGVLTIVTAGAGIATAANGGSLVLGGNNSATSTTTITDKGSTPLTLVTKKGKPPLKVSSKGLVVNLNAGELGGLTAKALSSGSVAQLPESPNALLNAISAAESGSGTETIKGVGLPAAKKVGTSGESLRAVKVLSTAKLAAGAYQVVGAFNAIGAICWAGPSSPTAAQDASLSLSGGGSLTTTIKLSKPGVINGYCASLSTPGTSGPANAITAVFLSGSLTALHLVSSTAGTHAPSNTVTLTDGGGF